MITALIIIGIIIFGVIITLSIVSARRKRKIPDVYQRILNQRIKQAREKYY